MTVAHDTYVDAQGELVYEPAEPEITRDLAERAVQMADSGCMAPSDAEAIKTALAYSAKNHRTADDLPSFF